MPRRASRRKENPGLLWVNSLSDIYHHVVVFAWDKPGNPATLWADGVFDCELIDMQHFEGPGRLTLAAMEETEFVK